MSDLTLTAASTDEWLSTIGRAYLIHGDDTDLVRAVLDALRHRTVGDGGCDFDWEELDASQCTVEDILASAQRVPVMAERRLVIVNGAEVYARTERRTEAARLAAAIAALPTASCLVLVVQPADTAKRRSAILTSQLDAAVRAVGHVIHCSPLEGAQLVSWAEAYAQRCGKTLARRAAHRLVERVADRRAVQHELDKLVAYVGDSPGVSVADVDELVGQAPEDVIFRLVDAVSARQTSEALQLLRKAARFESRSQTLAAKLIALLTRQVRLLWQARELLERGVSMQGLRALPPDIADDLPEEASIVSMAWKAGSIGRDARAWTRDELTYALAQLVECDAANKGEESGSRDALANLEMLIVSLGRSTTAVGSASI